MSTLKGTKGEAAARAMIKTYLTVGFFPNAGKDSILRKVSDRDRLRDVLRLLRNLHA